MQYCIINNDIALLTHYRALLQMPDGSAWVSGFAQHIHKEESGGVCSRVGLQITVVF